MTHSSFFSADERTFLFDVVRRAGNFALAHWPSSEDRLPFDVHTKEDGSPVTSVDLAVNEMIQGELSRRFPDYGLYSEELPTKEDLSQAKGVWVLDPIDGTQNFINGEPDFGVLLGLVVPGGKVVFAIAYFPARDLFFWGERGGGAFCNGERLAISTPEALRPQSIYVRNGGIAKKEYIYERELGTAHGFYFLLTGKVDALTVRITQHQEWDICPLILLVEESGAVVTDERGDEIHFHFTPPTFRYLVAAHSAIHPAILELLS
ncbi:MAG: inositol monophosphatase family protein [Bdellovibrionota bacterium]